jgi:hypothetical protein
MIRSIPDEKLREGYWYLMHNPTGFQSALMKIHPELVEYLISENVIGEGMNSKAQLRYHLTEFGKETVEMHYTTLTANLVRKELDKQKE